MLRKCAPYPFRLGLYGLIFDLQYLPQIAFRLDDLGWPLVVYCTLICMATLPFDLCNREPILLCPQKFLHEPPPIILASIVPLSW